MPGRARSATVSTLRPCLRPSRCSHSRGRSDMSPISLVCITLCTTLFLSPAGPPISSCAFIPVNWSWAVPVFWCGVMSWLAPAAGSSEWPGRAHATRSGLLRHRDCHDRLSVPSPIGAPRALSARPYSVTSILISLPPPSQQPPPAPAFCRIQLVFTDHDPPGLAGR